MMYDTPKKTVKTVGTVLGAMCGENIDLVWSVEQNIRRTTKAT